MDRLPVETRILMLWVAFAWNSDISVSFWKMVLRRGGSVAGNDGVHCSYWSKGFHEIILQANSVYDYFLVRQFRGSFSVQLIDFMSRVLLWKSSGSLLRLVQEQIKSFQHQDSLIFDFGISTKEDLKSMFSRQFSVCAVAMSLNVCCLFYNFKLQNRLLRFCVNTDD